MSPFTIVLVVTINPPTCYSWRPWGICHDRSNKLFPKKRDVILSGGLDIILLGSCEVAVSIFRWAQLKFDRRFGGGWGEHFIHFMEFIHFIHLTHFIHFILSIHFLDCVHFTHFIQFIPSYTLCTLQVFYILYILYISHTRGKGTTHQDKREKGKLAQTKRENAKWLRLLLRSISIRQPDRTYARTNETKRPPDWTHPTTFHF